MNLKLEITNTSFLRQPINKGKKVSCPCASKFTPMLLSFIDSHTKKEEEEEEEENLGFLGGRITLSLSLSLKSCHQNWDVLPRIWMQFLLIKMDKLWALFLAKWSSTTCVSETIIEGQHPKILLHQDSPRPNLEKELIHIWRRTSSSCTWRQGWWQDAVMKSHMGHYCFESFESSAGAPSQVKFLPTC